MAFSLAAFKAQTVVPFLYGDGRALLYPHPLASQFLIFRYANYPALAGGVSRLSAILP